MKQRPIVFIITKLELGGAQKVCLTLFKELHANNHHTFLITGPEGYLVTTVQDKKNVFFIPTLQREVGLRTIFNELRSFIHVIRLLARLKKQHPHIIVHTHSTKAGIIGRWAAWCVRIKRRVHTVHGFAFHEHQPRSAWWCFFLAEWITSFITTHFMCVSSHDVELGKRLLPHFAHKHSLIRAAVEQPITCAPATRTTLEQTPFIFGTIACFKPQKNLFDLLQAFAYVHQHNPLTRLEIIGDGVLRSSIETWITDHALTSAVTLHGWQDTVQPLLNRWHAFVLTSLWEGLPCSIIEARLAHLPVVAYKTGGIAEVIIHGKNGLLCAQKDWRSCGQAMLELTHNRSLYTSLQHHSDALHEFTYDYMVQQHADLYQNL